MAPRKRASSSSTRKPSQNHQTSQPSKFGIQHFFERHSQAAASSSSTSNPSIPSNPKPDSNPNPSQSSPPPADPPLPSLVSASNGEERSSQITLEISKSVSLKRFKFSPGMLIKQSQDDGGDEVTWKISPVNARLQSLTAKQLPGMTRIFSEATRPNGSTFHPCSQKQDPSCSVGKIEKWLSSPATMAPDKSMTISRRVSIQESEQLIGGVACSGASNQLGLREHRKALLELLDQVEDAIMEEPTTNDLRLHKNQDAACEKIHMDHDPIESSFRDSPPGKPCSTSHDDTFLVLEVLRLLNEQTGQERILHLCDEWFYSLIGPGDTINVIGDLMIKGNGSKSASVDFGSSDGPKAVSITELHACYARVGGLGTTTVDTTLFENEAAASYDSNPTDDEDEDDDAEYDDSGEFSVEEDVPSHEVPFVLEFGLVDAFDDDEATSHGALLEHPFFGGNEELRKGMVDIVLKKEFWEPKSTEAWENGMGISLFCGSSGAHPEAISALQCQYRMCAGIMELSNALIYGDRLCCGSSEIASAKLKFSSTGTITLWPKEEIDHNYRSVACFGGKEHNTVNDPTEAFIISEITRELVKTGIIGDEIGIITPYNSQVNLIRQVVGASVEVQTIDKYQKKLIMVRSCKILSRVPLLRLVIEKVDEQGGIIQISGKDTHHLKVLISAPR
ncbi:hypothetical protein COCNU_16G002700 [Cocos nucifera]|uniref:DNA replication ATP-dependent helicase/nuclease n=1 Tax=Cocos nucifera TaxID=13894 RepID=A0A8K0IXY9_COCNU|nr:hypothetical protein COCNU_16G002700 [Cocos nucifera]